MKKFSAILACVLVLAMTFAMTVSAGPHGIVENPPITVAHGTPTVDGTINENEGWSVSALMNAETLGYYWGQNPLTMDGNVKFAWDDDNFYFSANIIEGLSAVREADGFVYEEGSNQFNYSTGEDWIDVDTADPTFHYGYDGDVFGLMIDPLNVFVDYGYTGNQDYTPWYLVGLFEGDVAKMYRQRVNQGDITDQVTVAGHKTAEGWCFEAALPWDMIIKDVEDICFGDFTIDKAQLLANGALVKASCLYQDRFIDEEAGEVATFGRYITAPTTLPDGNPGHMGSGDHAMSCGITLTLSKELKGPEGDDTTTQQGGGDTTTQQGGDETEVVTDEKGNAVTDESGNKVTQKVNKTTTKKATTGTSTGGNAAQTFDIGIAVALGALATSGIGFVAIKKRR
ncbi:MAG: hypothetical protein IJB24_03885 [Clostridia bacterium]|nr:hypothetical protein [Clostridia bacterium]